MAFTFTCDGVYLPCAIATFTCKELNTFTTAVLTYIVSTLTRAHRIRQWGVTQSLLLATLAGGIHTQTPERTGATLHHFQ